ncbi:hypothetical protein ABMA27_008582 [Loxostege sticticalis]|uniref:Cytochrome P450 n=1 Tax=Loxostege sticticalis TaxID=481309 RepID=A0ABR3HBV5_LOXSC
MAISLSTVLLAVTVPALAYWLYWRWANRRMLRLAAVVPGPPALPVLGNALMFLTNTTGIVFKLVLAVGVTTVLLTAAVPALAYWVYWWWTYRRMLRLATVVLGRPALPVLGNALMFLTNTSEQLQKIAKLFDEYGDYVRFWLGPELAIAVKNPTDIRTLLSSNKLNQKGPLYNLMKPFIGPGILSGGPTWRLHRKIVTPSYNKKSVQQFSKVFNSEAEQLVRVLRNKRSDTYDIYYDVLTCTTQCVCQTLMGLSKEDSMQLPNLTEIVRKTQSMYNLIFKRMTLWWLQIPFIYWLTGHKKQQDHFFRLIDDFTSIILEKRRKALKTEVVDEELRSVVDRLIQSGELNDQEIKHEMFTLFTTSQEAAAKIAAGVMMILAHLPDWQEKVYEEIQEVVGSSPVTESHIKELHYLDMVYKETLRYFSIAAFIQRTVEEEITINDSRVFATAMIKTIVVHVIRSVHLEADGVIDDIPLEVAISVRSANGYQVRSRVRKEQNGVKANGVVHN